MKASNEREWRGSTVGENEEGESERPPETRRVSEASEKREGWMEARALVERGEEVRGRLELAHTLSRCYKTNKTTSIFRDTRLKEVALHTIGHLSKCEKKNGVIKEKRREGDVKIEGGRGCMLEEIGGEGGDKEADVRGERTYYQGQGKGKRCREVEGWSRGRGREETGQG
ncbi:hypothetical protein Pcinc_031559 [Petrolisthes cinctipes]|uniref:Uncharacterized protein n=1 Tax=Petrolisthes cinctipes TaxID=88211 RepID=A0AAE1EWF2_PETCI|nr:hypothetical protein Pcinc_031559 [Petrolisthes cinctipes]